MADPQIATEGFSKLAHAIRRSTALHVAMQITPPEGTVEDLLATADRLAAWIGGKAAAGEHAEGPEPLGKAWPPVD